MTHGQIVQCQCFVSSLASPTAHLPNRDHPTVFVVGTAAVPGRVEREANATLRLEIGWHGPFWDEVQLIPMRFGPIGSSAVDRKA